MFRSASFLLFALALSEAERFDKSLSVIDPVLRLDLRFSVGSRSHIASGQRTRWLSLELCARLANRQIHYDSLERGIRGRWRQTEFVHAPAFASECLYSGFPPPFRPCAGPWPSANPAARAVGIMLMITAEFSFLYLRRLGTNQ